MTTNEQIEQKLDYLIDVVCGKPFQPKAKKESNKGIYNEMCEMLRHHSLYKHFHASEKYNTFEAFAYKCVDYAMENHKFVGISLEACVIERFEELINDMLHHAMDYHHIKPYTLGDEE